MKIYIALTHNFEETNVVSAHTTKEAAEKSAAEAFEYWYDEGEYGQWWDTIELELDQGE